MPMDKGGTRRDPVLPTIPPPPPRRPPRSYAGPGEGNIGGSGSGSSSSSNLPGFVEPSYPSGSTAMPAVYQPSRVAALAPLIDQYLARYESPLAGLGRTFTKKSKKYGLDPRLLVAIAGAESGFGKNMREGTHNPFGWGPHIPFPSYPAAIEAVSKGLANNYFGEGYNTIPKIGSKWAPIGAGNDPTNLNSNWTRNVTKYYNELSKLRPGNAPIPGLAQVIFDPRGSWFNGTQSSQPYGGHGTHVHVGANNPRIMLRAIQIANRLGLSPRENPYVDPVDPVHTGVSERYGDFEGSGDPSYHYRLFSGRYGPQNRELGRGLDVSGGNTGQLGRYYDRILSLFAPGYTPNYGGGGYDITGTASPQQAHAYSVAQEQAANAGSAIMASATAEAGTVSDRRRRRKKAADEQIEKLVASLQQGARGAEMMTKKGRKRGV